MSALTPASDRPVECVLVEGRTWFLEKRLWPVWSCLRSTSCVERFTVLLFIKSKTGGAYDGGDEGTVGTRCVTGHPQGLQLRSSTG